MRLTLTPPSIALACPTALARAGALNAAAISDALGLASIKSRQWSIQETSATEGKGAYGMPPPHAQ